MSAGLIGVVIPLFLAECLSKDDRGRGTGIFQWRLTLGIVTAAAIGIYFSIRVEEISKFGPAVCVWLALSELMPTRIRSNGMSIALLLNQAVSTGIAAVFLPTVGRYG